MNRNFLLVEIGRKYIENNSLLIPINSFTSYSSKKIL